MSNLANVDKYNLSLAGTAFGTTAALQLEAEGRGSIQAYILNQGKKKFNPPEASNNMTLKFQASDDGAAWTDITPDGYGSPDIVVRPEGFKTANFLVTTRYIRVIGFGNAYGEAQIRWDGVTGLGLTQV